MLRGAEPLVLPGSRGAGGPPSSPSSKPFALPDLVFKRSGDFVRNEGVTINTFFMAALGVLMGRWSGLNQAVLGAICHGRPVGCEDVLGCFMQMRPVFVNFSDDPKCSSLLGRARQAMVWAQDVRRPVTPAVLKALNVGNVLVNYVRNASPPETPPPIAISMPMHDA